MAVQSPTTQKLTRRAYSAPEFAYMTGVSERQVRKGMATGEIRTLRLLGRVLIPASEVDRLLSPDPQTEGGRHD